MKYLVHSLGVPRSKEIQHVEEAVAGFGTI